MAEVGWQLPMHENCCSIIFVCVCGGRRVMALHHSRLVAIFTLCIICRNMLMKKMMKMRMTKIR